MTQRKNVRVLWTTNIVLPHVAGDIGLTETPFGGWLSTLANGISRIDGFELGIAMKSEGKKFARIERDNIVYYVIPRSRYDKFDVGSAYCGHVLDDFAPDVLHAHGSEMVSTARFMEAWPGPKLLSLQGVLHGIAPYQYGCISVGRLMDLRRPQFVGFALAMMLNKQLMFKRRMRAEARTIRRADYIVGRTLWDRAQAMVINPDATYVKCGEILRDEFREPRWSMNRCEPFSIFMGNGSTPLKGAHVALRALAILVRRHPAIKLRIAGPSPVSQKGPLRATFGYLAFLQTTIRDLGLDSHVSFTGTLDASGMAEQMRRSHLFIMPSLIENSPNTLGEAMLLGMPCVASYAGGIPSLAKDGEEVLLFRANDPVMLAFQIGRLLDDTQLCEKLSVSARARAMEEHAPGSVVQTISELYRTMAPKVQHQATRMIL